jgi:ubiquinone/menaquinone biosynthesis C-methylase UbiE
MTEDIKKIYRGYFVSKETISSFLACLPSFLNKEIKICDIGGGQGYLLDQVRKFYKDKGYKVSCWIVDYNKEQLKLAPPYFYKVCKNALEFYKDNFFDLIIMRSVLQFLLRKNHKIKVLNNIYKSLKLNGYFINQAFFLEKPDNRIIEKAYRYFNRFLKIDTLESLISIYTMSKFKNCKIKTFCPISVIDKYDIQKRFDLKNVIIDKIFSLFNENKNQLHSIEIEGNNFQIRASFVILEARKTNYQE